MVHRNFHLRCVVGNALFPGHGLVSWLWRVFESAFVRKLAYILAAALMALVFKLAHAQTQCYTSAQVGYPSNLSGLAEPVQCSTYEGCAAAMLAEVNAALPPSSGYPPFSSCTPSGALTAAQGNCYDGGFWTAQISPIAGACPTDCQNKPSLDIIDAIGRNVPGSVAGLLCVDGCGYTNSANSMMVGGARATVYGQAVSTGTSCGTGNAVKGTCASSGGMTLCYDVGTNKASVAGDLIAKTDQPAVGTCVMFASGGSMCTYTPTKPLQPFSQSTGGGAPSADGTTPMTPAAIITTGADSTGAGGVTSAYYTAAQNAASVTPVAGGKVSAPVPGTGTGGGASAANGDCGASAVNCTGDATVPSLDRTDTVQSNVQGYMDSIKSSPIISAIGSVANAFPTSAPVPTVPVTIHYGAFYGTWDVFSGFAAIWAGIASNLRFVFLAIWAVAGIRVVLSA